uniref:Putative O-antigen polymerase n=1 Tax=Magnetococcus massalia (strain MO-1) TaxID=451514 RepID=A0A1S7LN47_MAGMO|nr:Putative O-antigen polymerase [Candidatus Magnetococcus massalia]
MRDLVLTLFIMGMLPLAYLRPVVGLMMWSWIGYMNPHRLTWSYAYDFRFNFIVAFVTLAGVIFNRDIKLRIPMTATTVVWILFIIWMTVTTFMSFAPDKAMWEWQRVIKIQAMVVVTFIVVNDRKWLERLLWVIVISVGVWVIKGGIFTILSGGKYRVYGPLYSFIQDNNALALAVIMVIPMMVYLLMQLKKPWQRMLMWGGILLSLVTVVGSYSRGGLLGLGVISLLIMLRGKKRVFSLGAMLVAVLILLLVMPQSWKNRMDDLTQLWSVEKLVQDDSMMGRLNSWVFAYRLASDRPFIGGGFRTFRGVLFEKYAPVPEVHDAHSIYFEVLAEQGFFGFGLFILMHLLAVRLTMRTIKLARGHKNLVWAGQMAAMLQISMIGYYVSGAFLGLAYFDLPYQIIAMIIILYTVVQRERAGVQSTTSSKDVILRRTRNMKSIFGRVGEAAGKDEEKSTKWAT